MPGRTATATVSRVRKPHPEKVYVEDIDRTLFCNHYDGVPQPGATIWVRRGGSFRTGCVLDVAHRAEEPTHPRITVLTVTGRTLAFRYYRTGDGFRLVPTR